FRFLDLPPELRCMIYEHIEIATCRHTIREEDARFLHSDGRWVASDVADTTITLVRKSLETSILATCRIINREATTILDRKLRRLEMQPVRFYAGYSGATALAGY
ncbi:hypothetical protein EK21DRAFT_33735, partial [Setomelanomma holmii]